MKSFQDKVAVITGAAGGIGAALAEVLAKRGCHLALADLHEPSLKATARELRGHGIQVTTERVDVSDRRQTYAFRDRTLQEHGQVDLLINNAGMTMYGMLDEFTDAEIDTIIGVNLMGVIDGCRAFLPYFRERGEGHILNMSSMAAISGMPKQSTYSATKAAVRALSESLSAELSDTNIGISWMIAGPVGTDIINNSVSHDESTTHTLGKTLKQRGMPPLKAAKKLVAGIESGQEEIRLTWICDLFHHAHRLTPGLIRGSMKFANQRLANPND